jgi:hypothetical protein
VWQTGASLLIKKILPSLHREGWPANVLIVSRE